MKYKTKYKKTNISQRLNAAINYIEEHLDSGLTIDKVAQVAACSKFHFHRVFFAHFGVTYAEYVRRRRLTIAAVEVMNSNTSILDIAHNFGYSSPNAFTRAFRSIHGINPSDARASQTKITSYKRLNFPTDINLQNKGVIKMDYKIIEKPSFKIIGKRKDFDFETFTKEGPKFWKNYVGSDEYKKLYKLTNGRPGKVTDAPMLSVYFPNEIGDRDEFSDILGIESIKESDLSAFGQHNIPKAMYAEFNCTYKTSMKTNRYIYGEWFTSTGYLRDGSKPDIAAYFPIAFRPMSEMAVRWWIPVKKK